MEKADLKLVNLLISRGEMVVLFFKSDYCYLCSALLPMVENLCQRTEPSYNFYLVDVLEEGYFQEKYKEKIDGIPSFLCMKEYREEIMPDPEEPVPETWYTLEFIEKYLRSFKNENSFDV